MIEKKILELFGSYESFNAIDLNKDISLLSRFIEPLIDQYPLTKIIHRKEKKLVNIEPRAVEKVFSDLATYFVSCVNWKSPRTQFNITPPVINPAIAAHTLASVLNQTLVSDMASGGFAKLEIDIVRYVSQLAGWNSKCSSGVFTFGGTGTNMYGVKVGINKVDKDASSKGVNNVVTIDSNQAHSSHKTICDWLGIGTNKNVVIKANKNGELNPDKVILILNNLIKNGSKIGCITLSGGTTYDCSIDPIKKVSEGISDLVEKFNLTYRPHLHVDSVIGWVYLFFKNYDFEHNSLSFSEKVLDKIRIACSKITELKYADSFGVDFHKTGFCPYVSSLFMLKNKNDWKVLGKGAKDAHHQAFQLGSYNPGKYTLETSRGTNGPVTAYVTMACLGIKGFQQIIGNFMEVAEDIKHLISNSQGFCNCNSHALGWATMFLIKGGEPITYEYLIDEADAETIKNSNNLQKEFQKYITSQLDNWYISVTNEYQKSHNGIEISALKLYPMSPFTNLEHNQELILWLNKKRKQFLKEK